VTVCVVSRVVQVVVRATASDKRRGGVVATLIGDEIKVEKLLWEIEAAEAVICRLVGNPVNIVPLTIVATAFRGGEVAANML
jgi:hypothetical protein